MSELKPESPRPESDQAAHPDTDRRRVDPSDEVVANFVDALNALGADSRYLLDSLAGFVRTLGPVRARSLSDKPRDYLIESGVVTADKLAKTQADIDRGGFQLSSIESWFSEMHQTLSLEGVTAFLGCDEDDVMRAVAEQRLHAVEIAGRLRFPAWQLSLRSPGQVLPHLQSFIPALEERWGWISISRFMNTRQEDLVAKGRKTPGAWLEDGGDPEAVRRIVQSGGPSW